MGQHMKTESVDRRRGVACRHPGILADRTRDGNRGRERPVSLVFRIHRDERGMGLLFVGVGLMAFLVATTLAVDVGMLMTARNQTQNAADAGALAGAVALAFNDFNDRSPTGPAVQNALSAATDTSNNIMGSPGSVSTADVTFPTDPGGQANRIGVVVHRTSERGNPLSMLVGAYFGVSTADVVASATGEAGKANAETCVKPWAIPDKWQERQTPPFDVNDTFSAFPTNPSVFPDIYRGPSNGSPTGYTQEANVGLQITLTPIVSNVIKAGMFIPLQASGDSGASDYQDNISGCDGAMLHFGDNLAVEPSATPTDTSAGAQALIDQDPTAYWNSATSRVVSTMNPSPRVVVIPLYDPYYFDQGKKVGIYTQIRIANFMGFFIESLNGTNVVGRIVPVTGLIDPAAAAAPAGSFPRAIRLVE